jgi:hypothetical protein
MNNRIESYVQSLLSQKVNEEDLDENISIFVNFIKKIYKGRDIAIFTFPFLERFDDFISNQENIDMVEYMFDLIKREFPNCDIITSGRFGEWIYKIVEDGQIDFEGNLIVMSGSIRKVKQDKNNIVHVVKNRYEEINRKFIFLDDSFVNGGTRDRINDFLHKFNSKIIKSFVFYTHNQADPEKVFSIYCYSENHPEEIIPISNYIKHLNKINLEEYEEILLTRINNGGINNIKDLIKNIIELTENTKESVILKYKNFIK